MIITHYESIPVEQVEAEVIRNYENETPINALITASTMYSEVKGGIYLDQVSNKFLDIFRDFDILPEITTEYNKPDKEVQNFFFEVKIIFPKDWEERVRKHLKDNDIELVTEMP